MPKKKRDLSSDEAPKRLLELQKMALNLCSGPHNMDDSIDPILDLLRTRNILEAQESLENLKAEVGTVLTMLWQLIRGHVERLHEQEIEIADLRVQLIEAAIKYAELNDDPKAIAIGEDLMSKQTFFVTAAIADLDPDG